MTALHRLAVGVLLLAGCDGSFSDVRDLPAPPTSQAIPMDEGHGRPQRGAGWEPTLQIVALIPRTYGVPVLGYQMHFISDAVTVDSTRAFFDGALGERGFRRSGATDRWALRWILGEPQVTAWVREVEAEAGRVDRTVVVTAYPKPIPDTMRDRSGETFYIVFLGRETVAAVPAGADAAPGPPDRAGTQAAVP